MYQLISGAIMLGFWVGGLILFGFYRQEKARLLLKFAVAFWMLAFERFVLGFLGPENEHSPPIYFIRLLAFAIITFAIVQENRGGKSKQNG